MGTKPLRPEDPRRLGDYQLLARLGEGGMGTVFLGRDPEARLVAVKAIRREYADREEFRARFRSEVNRVRTVPSFCTAAVVDADPDHEIPYLVVEYVDGPSLQEVVSEGGSMSAGDLHSVAVGVAAALTAIHGAGVIHRDLKPTNVLLSLGLPKVIDFGIARALEVTSRHTRTDQVVGTVSYMAPECLDPTLGEISPAADIFAWGAVVAYAGTGRSPFAADSPMVTAARILTAPPDLSGLPSSLSGLVGRALAKNPADRPSANDLVQQLLSVRPAAPQPLAGRGSTRPAAGRFANRDLLEQLIAEGPTPAPARVPAPRAGRSSRPSPARVPVPRAARSARPSPAGKGGNHHARAEPRSPLVTVRRAVYAAVALVVLTVAGIAVAAAGDDRSPPVAVPTTAGAASAVPLDYQGPAFFDPLSTPGRFRESSGETGSCKYDRGQLRVRATGPRALRCPGPDDEFGGDQAIAVDVNLAGAASCAMVWFRYRGNRGYQMTACADRVVMEVFSGAVVTATGRVQSAALSPGTRHKLSIKVVGQHASVTVDGAETLQAGSANADITTGSILLGAANDESTGNADVHFANLDVRAS